MLSLPANARAFLGTRPIDLRKSFDGLCAAVEVVFQRSRFDGHRFLFVNKRPDRTRWNGQFTKLYFSALFRSALLMTGQ